MICLMKKERSIKSRGESDQHPKHGGDPQCPRRKKLFELQQSRLGRPSIGNRYPWFMVEFNKEPGQNKQQDASNGHA
jgi:hypothetical protein